MSKTTMTAAFAVILAVAMPMAYGQTTATTTSSPTAEPAASGPAVQTTGPANHMLPGQNRATQIVGAAVYDSQNQNIGEIKDIILDREGRVAAVVLNVGGTLGVGGRYVALGIDDVKIANDGKNKPRFTVRMTKDQLKSAQAYDLDEKNAASGTSTPPADRTH